MKGNKKPINEKKEKPLKINATFEDVLKVSVKDNPKPSPKKSPKKK